MPNILTLGKFFIEVKYVESALSNLRDAITAIERLQSSAVGSVTRQEESKYQRELEELVNQTNKIANMIREKLNAMEEGNDRSDANYQVRRTQISNLAHKFMDILIRYQNCQVAYQKSHEERLRRHYLIVNPDASEKELKRIVSGDAQSNQVFANQLVASQREAGASLALEDCKYRHEQIIQLAKAINDLQQLFKDMQTIVKNQDALCLSVSSYVNDTMTYTEEASKEVKSAVKIQRVNRKRMICIMICLALAITAIALVVYFTFFHSSVSNLMSKPSASSAPPPPAPIILNLDGLKGKSRGDDDD